MADQLDIKAFRRTVATGDTFEVHTGSAVQVVIGALDTNTGANPRITGVVTINEDATEIPFGVTVQSNSFAILTARRRAAAQTEGAQQIEKLTFRIIFAAALAEIVVCSGDVLNGSAIS